jgi:hypothetical protein
MPANRGKRGNQEPAFDDTIVQAAAFGGFYPWLAKQKNRDTVSWFFLGALLSFVASIALAVAPPLKSRADLRKWDQLNQR